VEHYTSTELLEGLRFAGGLPSHTELPLGRGRADWVGAQLRYRMSLKQQGDVARWRLSVGDEHLGRSFNDGGILAVVAVSDAPDVAPLRWPTSADEAVTFVRSLRDRVRPAWDFVTDRLDLCELLISPDDRRRGDLVAELKGSYVERVLRAYWVAHEADEHGAAAVAHAILATPPTDGSPHAPSSMLDQARIFADQWSYQAGLTITVPDPPSVESEDLPDSWERVG
jgi:hypothetical protein